MPPAKRTAYVDLCHRCKQRIPRRVQNCPHCGVNLERLSWQRAAVRVLITLGFLAAVTVAIWVFYWGISGSEGMSGRGPGRPADRMSASSSGISKTARFSNAAAAARNLG